MINQGDEPISDQEADFFRQPLRCPVTEDDMHRLIYLCCTLKDNVDSGRSSPSLYGDFQRRMSPFQLNGLSISEIFYLGENYKGRPVPRDERDLTIYLTEKRNVDKEQCLIRGNYRRKTENDRMPRTSANGVIDYEILAPPMTSEGTLFHRMKIPVDTMVMLSAFDAGDMDYPELLRIQDVGNQCDYNLFLVGVGLNGSIRRIRLATFMLHKADRSKEVDQQEDYELIAKFMSLLRIMYERIVQYRQGDIPRLVDTIAISDITSSRAG